jgi:hypothetical protein
MVTVGWAGADPQIRKTTDEHAEIKIRRTLIASARLANPRFALSRTAEPITAPERSSPTASCA